MCRFRKSSGSLRGGVGAPLRVPVRALFAPLLPLVLLLLPLGVFLADHTASAVSIPTLDAATKTLTVTPTNKVQIVLDDRYPIFTKISFTVTRESDNRQMVSSVATDTGSGAVFTVPNVDLTDGDATYQIRAFCYSSHCNSGEGRVELTGVHFVLEGSASGAAYGGGGNAHAAAGRDSPSSATGITAGQQQMNGVQPGMAPASPAPASPAPITSNPTMAPISSSPTRAPATATPTKQPTLPPSPSPTTLPPTMFPTSAPTPNNLPIVQFSPHFANSMVLQRAPSSSVVYGTVEVDPAVAQRVRDGRLNITDAVEVDVTLQGSEGHLATHIVPAVITTSTTMKGLSAMAAPAAPGGPNVFHFRALLPPVGTSASVVNTLKKTAPAAHSYSLYARCKAGCLEDGPDSSRSRVTSVHDVKFGDVWVCLGEQDMAVPLEYTFARNASYERVQHGGYGNVRYKSWSADGASTGNSLDYEVEHGIQWSKPSHSRSQFMKYSAACWYFAESLVDQLGVDAPPIGLVELSRPSTRIEDWVDDVTVMECTDTLPRMTNGGRGIYESDVAPLTQMSIKGWVWYQGSSNVVGRYGNATSGYACLLPKMIESYRKAWSLHPGTTKENVPFGIVTLHPSGFGGHPDAGRFRLAQTAGYGTIPNPAMPNTFFASAYDLDDPFDDATCYGKGCCDPNIVFGNKEVAPQPCVGSACDMCSQCRDFCETLSRTNYFEGPTNPRPKRFVGERLARSAAVEVYGKPGDGVGPTIAGCRMMKDDTIVVHFRRKLLGGERVEVQDYDRDLTMSKMEVMVIPDAFCLQTKYVNGKMVCIDDGSGNADPIDGGGVYTAGSGAWVPVDIESAGPAEIRVNLTKSGGVAFAIRYAWDGTCCSYDPSGATMGDEPTKACPVASCPIVGNETLLPADPFVARIVGGKCECIGPQSCDSFLGVQAFRFRIRDVPMTEESFLIASGSLLAFVLFICSICTCRAMCCGGRPEKEGYEMVDLSALPQDDTELEDHEVW